MTSAGGVGARAGNGATARNGARQPVALETAPGDAASAASEEAAARAELERRLSQPMPIISLPGDPPDPRLGAPRPLSPEVEQRRQVALVAWKREAQRVLSGCIGRLAEEPRPTPVSVFLAPRRRALGEPRQVISPRWATLSPSDLQRLSHDVGAVIVRDCLARLSTTSLSVALSGDALAHEFPSSAESLVVDL